VRQRFDGEKRLLLPAADARGREIAAQFWAPPAGTTFAEVGGGRS